LNVLIDPGIKKIAIANPAHAPYGRAAVAAMQHDKIYDQVSPKFVMGENISQTMSFVVAGSADIGIVALSLALSPALKDKGKYVEIPGDTYPPNRTGSGGSEVVAKQGNRPPVPELSEDPANVGFVAGLRLFSSEWSANSQIAGRATRREEKR
jgi:molybdate transport system substrate-binding protein